MRVRVPTAAISRSPCPEALAFLVRGRPRLCDFDLRTRRAADSLTGSAPLLFMAAWKAAYRPARLENENRLCVGFFSASLQPSWRTAGLVVSVFFSSWRFARVCLSIFSWRRRLFVA